MKIRLEILRRENSASNSHWQIIELPDCGEKETVASILMAINTADSITDVDGKPVDLIQWECSCLQKKCGACAMRINGRPALACDSKLLDVARAGVVRLEPLKKFPVIADLIVDRSVMRENLKALRLWLEEQVTVEERVTDIAYEASRCLQCGCCLEVCPNFSADGLFAGTAALPPMTRLIAELPKEKRKELDKLYRKRIYNGCGKSLACRNICPAGIDVERLLVNSNAMAVWKRLFR